MISEQFETLQELFSLISAGINQPYEKLEFESDVFESYMVMALVLTIDGKDKADVETTYNHSLLSDLIKKLHKQSLQQGDDWKVLIITYAPGEQVKTNYIYQHREENLL
ncbi:hypothetical protein LPB260_25800 [Pseudomonas sp. LPB0260]|uniref:hypothetical protein n=1 Tax=Pseudomonas sp. LPB0260 TaxID=2614442 RepID=UPI0015C1CAFE|nr:hypothetical protein [Pseudomonas sp. LPB0260]QLC74115.1 hypothetical protein LPB260_10850 [Pseudomonas sp. LPB0260]QLC76886.1 hypothetical protein LPB260_25800 [Pseudomonas sp. LPB0260]